MRVNAVCGMCMCMCVYTVEFVECVCSMCTYSMCVVCVACAVCVCKHSCPGSFSLFRAESCSLQLFHTLLHSLFPSSQPQKSAASFTWQPFRSLTRVIMSILLSPHPLPQSVISQKLGEVFLFTDAFGNFVVFRLMLSLSRCANICLILCKLIVQKSKKPL